MKQSLSLTERKRLDILAAAQKEFKEKSFVGASMDALAKRANVSKRTVYNHFPSKEALFHHMVKQMLDSFCQAVNIEYQSDTPLAEQLLVAAQSELTLLTTNQFCDLHRIILAEFIRSPELATSSLEHLGQEKRGLHAWISAAINDGRLQDVDSDYATQQFLGLIKATAFWPQLLRNQEFPSAEQQKVIAEDAVFMFLARYQR